MPARVVFDFWKWSCCCVCSLQSQSRLAASLGYIKLPSNQV